MVACADLHDRVGGAGHGAGVDDLGHLLQDALQLLGGDGAAAEQLDVRSVDIPSTVGSTWIVNERMTPSATSLSTRRFTAEADSPTEEPMSP